MPACPRLFGVLCFCKIAILQYFNISPTLREFFPQTPTFFGHPSALLRRIYFHKFRLTGSSPLHKVAQTTKRTVSPTNFLFRTQPHWRTCLWGRLGTVNQRPYFKGLRTQPILEYSTKRSKTQITGAFEACSVVGGHALPEAVRHWIASARAAPSRAGSSSQNDGNTRMDDRQLILLEGAARLCRRNVR